MYASDPLLAAVAPRIHKDHTTIHKDMGAAPATGNDIGRRGPSPPLFARHMRLRPRRSLRRRTPRAMSPQRRNDR
jgi:hypothetical protein